MLTKISPFFIEKAIKACAGEVKKVSKMKNGSLLVECFREQQSKNLLTLTKIGEHPIKPAPHVTLNYSQGIIRDRDRDLSSLGEELIEEELAPQGVVKSYKVQKKR